MADEKKEGGFSFFGAKKDEPAKGGIGAGIGGAFFGKHEESQSFKITDLSNQINNLSRRLKMLEERYTNMRNNMQLTDQNVLDFNKEVNRTMKVVHSDLLDFKREFEDLKEKVKLIVRELKDTAKSEDVELLEKYINIWEPMNFITRKEVDKIIDEKIEEKMAGMMQPDIETIK